ncbi:shikimate dehydrogenase [Streptomyces sp. NPDC050560]|uniref:shikimate dehydrogenase n=1 Tax=Streptomyces sp. NPDC050560 TaxID=3365630 RepID=UPI0037A6D55C
MSAPGRRRMRFVGVSTGESSIIRVFPPWSRLLGLDADLVGLDIPVDAPRAAYRAAAAELRDDPVCAGALVTTHKIALYEACHDLFEGFDDFARACGEVSSVTVRGGRLWGAAKDPVTAGLSLEEFLPPGRFADGAEVLCLGAGGAGTAIGWYLARRAEAPRAMHFVDTVPGRLDRLRRVVGAQADRTDVRTHPADAAALTALLAGLPRGSLVVNATGLGKDRPGSPLPPGAVLPAEAVVWELNYRGRLDFLRQAQAQQGARGLTVVDGWRYFIHGWSQVIAEVFGAAVTPEVVDELAAAAGAVR